MNREVPEGGFWFEVAIPLTAEAHEPLSALLMEGGAVGSFSETRPREVLKVYFPCTEAPEEIRRLMGEALGALAEAFPEIGPLEPAITPLPEVDWGESWKRFFTVEPVTPRLTVYPAWIPVPEGVSGRAIRMDPGPAFGTGKHPTTRMCLEALEAFAGERPWTMLDVGTGSGILAIYAVLLGARRVVGVDCDPEALRWAGRNLTLNGLSGLVVLSPDPVEGLGETFSLVAANLILGEIERLFSSLLLCVEPGGRLVLSGLLEEQGGRIQTLAAEGGCSIVQVLRQEEWVALVLAPARGSQGP